ncbi:MAG: tRNA lysidine(34) synthetase TilS [Candidatus Melainabacteria bacterium]|nr:tRNA lysidine(34) synthetase TilS [Candidatus Melainabacteria bacterium]
MKSDDIFKGKQIGLAVSGGADSIVLLDVFNKLKYKYDLSLFVLHYNHKWRKTSIKDSNLVEKYCIQNNIKFLYKETKGKVIKNEEEARNQRYSFFKQCARKYNLKFICTAHHKDDQLETILFRLIRGTGPNGLLPIKKFFNLSGNVKLFRPFLDFTKKEIIDYAKQNNLSYITDKTNYDLKYKRNLIRLKVIPNLKKINGEFLNNILVCSDLIYSQNVALGNYFLTLLKKLSTGLMHYEKRYSCIPQLPVRLSRKQYLRLDLYTQKCFLYWLLTLYGIKGNISKIDSLNEVIKNQETIDLSNKYLIKVHENEICLEEKQKNKTQNNIVNKKILINGKKKVITLMGKSILMFEPFKRKHFDRRFPSDKKQIAYVDFSKYKMKSLTVRHRKPHDTIHPLGFPYTVKLKKYLINKKIPQDKRYNLPLLCFNNEVLWLPGYSLSEKVRVLDKPTHILKIKHLQ